MDGSEQHITGIFHRAGDRASPLLVTFVLPRNSWFQPSLLQSNATARDKVPTYSTLAAFRHLWDSLPLHEAPPGLKIPLRKDPKTPQEYDVPLEVCPEGVLVHDDGSTGLDVRDHDGTTVSLRGQDSATSRFDFRRIDLVVGRASDRKASDGARFGYLGEIPNEKGQKVFFAFAKIAVLTLDKRNLAKLAQVADSNLDSFGESFMDLSLASHDFQYLDLEDVRTFISGEAAKGTEVFEAFGMKIPADQLTFGGITLVVSIQLYFLIYLRQLSGKLEVGDPGWDVPWMGMDQSFLAKVVFFCTVVLLPIVAIATVAYHPAAQRLHAEAIIVSDVAPEWKRAVTFITDTAWLLPAVGGPLLSAAALAILSWKRRPKLVESPTETSPPAE